jgi:hypothetical protein
MPAAAPTSEPQKAPAYVSRQSAPGVSGQSPYTQAAGTTQQQPRHHLFSWLFHDDESAEPLASSQLPAATFPTSYTSPQCVLPTGQGTAGACETGNKAPKKPCFLKVWIHDFKNSHGSGGADCGDGGPVYASAQSNVAACETAKSPKKPCFLKVWIHDWKQGGTCSQGDSCGQGGTTASPQGPTICETAAAAPKKPCFLKVWIHDWKSGHGSGCGSCQTGGGSGCKSCKCCGGGGTQVTATGQGGVALAQPTAQQVSTTRP